MRERSIFKSSYKKIKGKSYNLSVVIKFKRSHKKTKFITIENRLSKTIAEGTST